MFACIYLQLPAFSMERGREERARRAAARVTALQSPELRCGALRRAAWKALRRLLCAGRCASLRLCRRFAQHMAK